MALVPETGSGIAGANTWATLAESKTFFAVADRATQGAVWIAASDGTLNEALLVGARKLASRYRGAWLGTPLTTTQALPLPRYEFSDADGKAWPVADQIALVKEAQCEFAYLHLATPLNEALERGGQVLAVSVGPISESYSPGAPGGRSFAYIDGLMAPLLFGVPGMVRLVR